MLYDLYNSGKEAMLTGLNFEADTIKIALLGAAYTPNIDTHRVFEDISANEVSGAGYTAGGTAISNGVVTMDAVNDLAKADADDLTIPAITVTFQYAVLYKDTGNPATSPLIGYWDNESTISTAGKNLKIAPSTSGIINLSSAGFGF